MKGVRQVPESRPILKGTLNAPIASPQQLFVQSRAMYKNRSLMVSQSTPKSSWRR